MNSAINARTYVFDTFPSTEMDILPGEVPPIDEWSYYCYNECLGHSFRYFAEDMHELLHQRDSAIKDF